MREDERWLDSQFVYSERHGIALPNLQSGWDALTPERQAAIVSRWEMIRGAIPDRIHRLEEAIRAKQAQLFEEEDFARSCLINDEIADLASRINDLNIWFRTRQELEPQAKRPIG
ncbi:hypothetical protein [Cohnella hongkongensis]|uniref:Uncharacterized protein n=1 Tax=Cohnella hongkongensis TaxID=178337 RepID=A0ABV9FFI4_9BACL